MNIFLSSGNPKVTRSIEIINLVRSGGGMVRFKELGFGDFDEYISNFFDILLPSNKTYEYFVDWDKVKRAVNKYLEELSLLNCLTEIDASNRKEYLRSLLKKYLRIVQVIPLLVAARLKNGTIDIFDPELEQFVMYKFIPSRVNKNTICNIVELCFKTGIIVLFREVKDIHDYLLGVEVGMDTNARKNRSGDIFEKVCQEKVKRIISNEFDGFVIENNDPKFSLYPLATEGKSKGKTHDIVVYRGSTPILIVECNFYNVSGSKPVSIAESYIGIYRAAKERNIEFLWVTDGPAWYQMKEPLLRGMKEMDWVIEC